MTLPFPKPEDNERTGTPAPSHGDTLRPVVTFSRDAVLEKQHMAAAFGVSVDSIERQDFPCFYIGRSPRWIWGQVLDECARRAATPSAGDILPMRRRQRRRRAS